jgi:hypothetical protein
VSVEYTLDPEDIASARLLTIGIRPKPELALSTRSRKPPTPLSGEILR